MHRSPYCLNVALQNAAPGSRRYNTVSEEKGGVNHDRACANCTHVHSNSESTFTMLQSLLLPGLLLFSLLAGLRLYYLISGRGRAARTAPRSTPCSTLVVLGSGGHTAEMLRILGGMRLENYQPRVYVAAGSDSMSVTKAEAFESRQDCRADVRKIPRARQVLQSYLTSVFSTLLSVAYCVPLVLRVWPDLVLCNGPGTCIPVCATAFLIKFMGLHDVKLVYVESICRVEALSLSGKLLYYLADHMVVQWPELQNKYPRTTYLGKIM